MSILIWFGIKTVQFVYLTHKIVILIHKTLQPGADFTFHCEGELMS